MNPESLPYSRITFPVDAKLGFPEAQRLFTYPPKAFTRFPVDLTSVWLEFDRLLRGIGFSNDGVVGEGFYQLLCSCFTPAVLERAGIAIESPAHQWRDMTKIGLGVFALGMPLSDFLMRASICRFPQRLSVDPVVVRIHDLAPAAVQKMRTQFGQITIWSLADRIGDDLGDDFMSNYACISRVRYALERHAETDGCYAERVVDLMYQRPTIFRGYSTINEALRALGLSKVLAGRAELREEARRAFKGARGTLV